MKFDALAGVAAHRRGPYNDAFRPILGAKPEALSRPFNEVWAEHGAKSGRSLAGRWWTQRRSSKTSP